MLLTLKPSLQNGCSPPHAYSSPQLTSSKTSAPSGAAGGTLPPLPDSRPRKMSTPHRGLPPPLGMTLPNPERAQPPASLSQPMGNLPAPPSQWQGADESMRNWLAAKAEEDKRKQEEEKTRQESLRLEQRRIEQTMLRESLQGGVPPHMVPMVFAGMGGGSLASTSVEWAQHYMAQISLQQQQHLQQPPQTQSLPPPQSSPDLRRDRSTTGPQPNPYGSQQPPSQSASSSTALVQQQQGSQVPSYGAHYPIPAISGDRLRQGAQGAALPPLPGRSNLSRLNTGEMQIQAPPQGGIQLAGHHPLQQSSTAQQQEQQSTSPSIYFHHWVPPNSQKDPPSSATKSQHSSPYSQNTSSHLRSEYVNSPKKRKTTSSHTSGPSQPSRTPETSPRISQMVSAGRRRAHSNQQSDTSSRGTHEAAGQINSRPASRARQRSTSDAESGNHGRGPARDETSSSRATGLERKRTGSGTPKGEAENPP